MLTINLSDGVLNPSGIRFGSSEIYAITETITAIEDSICVGQRRKIDADERVLLFVKLAPGYHLSAELKRDISMAIRQGCSPRHVPKYIFQVSDIPYTVSGKKCEINVKKIVSGLDTFASGTIANPHSLKQYEPYADLVAEGLTAPVKTSKL
jgi:acetoacetyl-CoA synthetase